MTNSILLRLLDWLLSRCKHPDYMVKADILEGDNGLYGVGWCESCGAFRHVKMAFESGEKHQSGEWRRPQPLYDLRRQASIREWQAANRLVKG